jgi:hypothetical protein
VVPANSDLTAVTNSGPCNGVLRPFRMFSLGRVRSARNHDWIQTDRVLLPYEARLTGALEDYYASPIGVDGKVYIASEHGKVVVLRAAGDWEILAINELDSDIYATPAISNGQMYIRTRSVLYAIGSSN